MCVCVCVAMPRQARELHVPPVAFDGQGPEWEARRGAIILSIVVII